MTLDWAIHRNGETTTGLLVVPDGLTDEEVLAAALEEFRRMQDEREENA